MQIESLKQLGLEVRRKRKVEKLSLEQTAMVSGVSMSFLRSLEAGKPSCQFDLVLKVLASLGMAVEATGYAPAPLQQADSRSRKLGGNQA